MVKSFIDYSVNTVFLAYYYHFLLFDSQFSLPAKSLFYLLYVLVPLVDIYLICVVSFWASCFAIVIAASFVFPIWFSIQCKKLENASTHSVVFTI